MKTMKQGYKEMRDRRWKKVLKEEAKFLDSLMHYANAMKDGIDKGEADFAFKCFECIAQTVFSNYMSITEIFHDANSIHSALAILEHIEHDSKKEN